MEDQNSTVVSYLVIVRATSCCDAESNLVVHLPRLNTVNANQTVIPEKRNSSHLPYWLDLQYL